MRGGIIPGGGRIGIIVPEGGGTSCPGLGRPPSTFRVPLSTANACLGRLVMAAVVADSVAASASVADLVAETAASLVSACVL